MRCSLGSVLRFSRCFAMASLTDNVFLPVKQPFRRCAASVHYTEQMTWQGTNDSHPKSSYRPQAWRQYSWFMKCGENLNINITFCHFVMCNETHSLTHHLVWNIVLSYIAAVETWSDRCSAASPSFTNTVWRPCLLVFPNAASVS